MLQMIMDCLFIFAVMTGTLMIAVYGNFLREFEKRKQKKSGGKHVAKYKV